MHQPQRKTRQGALKKERLVKKIPREKKENLREDS